jgi:hypothetical protein
MFVGRKKELAFLNSKYESKKAEFIVLYGRRRIGKTAIIREFVKEKPHVYYSAVQITDSVQLNKMTGIVTGFFKADLYSDRFSDWEALFRFIADNSNNDEKLVLVMDEFPYMVEGNISIPSILQNTWDHLMSSNNIMIILCGSSMSFMEKEILSEKNPLYGRTTGILKIRELDFESSRGFMGDGSLEDHIQYYSIFSGVPYYLSLIDPLESLEHNIKNNILRNGSVLFNETEFLLKQELREVHQYNAIIESVALGNTRINDIYQKTEIEKTKLPYYINNLIDLGIIIKEYPATIKTKEKAKKRSGLYKIANSYFRFYYTFVYPYISELMDGGEDIILEDVVMERLPMFVAQDFENISIEYLRKVAINKELSFRPVKIGRWWNKDREIDIVAYDLKNNYLFGECKWRNEKIGKTIYDKLVIKSMDIDKNPDGYMYMLFSKSGFTAELRNYAVNNDQLILVDFSGVDAEMIK